MDKIVELFEDLIRRNIAPSASLFVLLASGHLIAAAIIPGAPAPGIVIDTWVTGVSVLYKSIKSVTFIGATFLVVLVGLSYVLSTLHQIVYDNFLKTNFNSVLDNCFFNACGWNTQLIRNQRARNAYLKQWRESVRDKLKLHMTIPQPTFNNTPPHVQETDVELSDYLLYEIVGGIDPTDTRRFVNDAKAYGIVFISLILVIPHLCYAYWSPTCGSLNAAMVVISCFLVIILFILGRETVKAQYRARALRLYVNFLAMPDARITRILQGREG